MTGAMYGYKSAPTARSVSAFGASNAAPSAPAASPAPGPSMRAAAPVVNGSNGSSSSIPMTDATPAALFAASALACYFDVPYSSLLLLLGAAAAAYAVYANGLAAIRWWVWALAAVAAYMYTAGPCSDQFGADYARAAELLNY